MRSIDGCWTCRLRRKKCDERHPVCRACSALHITCYYDEEKPAWMDSGERQIEMAEQLKREVKAKAPFRRSNSFSHSYRDGNSEPGMGPLSQSASTASKSHSPVFALRRAPSQRDHGRTRPSSRESLGKVQMLPAWRDPLDSRYAHEETALAELDRGLIMYYFDYFFPLLFPLYRPPLFEGGRSWLLDIVMQSQAMEQTTLCLSSYFFSLALEAASSEHEACNMFAWKKLLENSNTAFRMLKQELEALNEGSLQDHLAEAVRIMGSIMQLERFETTACSYENCQAHLNAALVLFKQILDGAAVTETPRPVSGFRAVMSRLGRLSSTWAVENIRVPSPDQAAFRFFSALLVVDDIIASTALEKAPTLHEYHTHLLLGCDNGTCHEDAPVDIEAIVGCQNWVMIQIGEIAALDAWKKQRKKDGEPDVMELVARAKAIQGVLQSHLVRLEAASTTVSSNISSVTDIFNTYNNQPLTSDNERAFVTRVWAHAAIVYLFVVVSGWQPSNADVRHHVKSTIDLLVRHRPSPALLRTLIWPFCVAGCLAERAEESVLRDMMDGLRPRSVFGTMHKAFEIMENVWRSRDMLNVGTWDLTASFQSLGHFVLLV